jgi:glycosyltransferase involved in cell wall biosynthesis
MPATPLEEGGGATFEREVFQALLENAGDTAHEFVVFGPQPQPPAAPGKGRIERVFVRYGLARTIGAGIRRGINRFAAESLRLPSPFRRENWIDGLLEEHRVDFFWNLNPFTLTKLVPYITVVWDLQFRRQPYFPEFSVDGRFLRWDRRFAELLRQATFVITGTRAGKEEIEFLYQVPAERIAILPHPTPEFARRGSGASREEVRKKYGLPERYVFYPAQLWPHKNHATLLYAVKRLRERDGLSVSVVLAGSDQGNGSYLRRLVRELGLEQDVRFLGFVPQEDLAGLYRNASALAYLSLCGPENLPPLEAFALGCPVLASDVSGASEQLGDAALLVDGNDVEKTADGLRKILLDEPLRQALVERGRQRAERFTGEDFVRGVFALLDAFEPIRRCWSAGEPFRPVYRIRKALFR